MGRWVGGWLAAWVGGWVGDQVGGWVAGWVGDRVGGWVGVCRASGEQLITFLRRKGMQMAAATQLG